MVVVDSERMFALVQNVEKRNKMKNIVLNCLLFIVGGLIGYFILPSDSDKPVVQKPTTEVPERITFNAMSIDGVTVTCHVIRRGFNQDSVKSSVHTEVGQHTAMWLHCFANDSLKVVGELVDISFDKEFEEHLVNVTRTNGDYIRAKKELEFAMIQAQVEKEMVDRMVDSLERAKKKSKH